MSLDAHALWTWNPEGDGARAQLSLPDRGGEKVTQCAIGDSAQVSQESAIVQEVRA